MVTHHRHSLNDKTISDIMMLRSSYSKKHKLQTVTEAEDEHWFDLLKLLSDGGHTQTLPDIFQDDNSKRLKQVLNRVQDEWAHDKEGMDEEAEELIV